MLERPVAFFAVEWMVTELFLAGSQRFDGQGRVDQTDIVIDRAKEFRVLEVAFAGIEDRLTQPVVDLEVRAARIRNRVALFGMFSRAGACGFRSLFSR